MSDPAGEPGAPSDGATKLPPASQHSLANEVQRQFPRLTAAASTPDRIILRLNKLLASPGGLSSFLSTFNYTLYLLAYFEAKSLPLKARLYQLLKVDAPVAAVAAGPSHILALGALLSNTRTTLRLFGLFPIYAWFRQLLQGPKPGQDQVIYATAFTQCLSYIAFQFLENVGFLTDSKILPESLTARWASPTSSKTAKIYLWSYRFWLVGVTCDFVRLAREAQLERVKRASRPFGEKDEGEKQDRENDAKWWAQLVVPISWYPIALHASLEGGLPWLDLGLTGLLGTAAGLGRFTELWAATADA